MECVMNQFVAAAIQVPDHFTENGAETFSTSLDSVVDLFFKIGASRDTPDQAVGLFRKAYRENPALAVRTALWGRDVRGGAGEREVFRQILRVMSEDVQLKLIDKIVEVGRWDDLEVLLQHGTPFVQVTTAKRWKDAVLDGNALAAKWCSRKGLVAVKLRGLWGMSPKQYRKTIVSATNVVEQKMCAKQWDDIEFDHVPSVAAARYNAAFMRNAAEKYAKYKDALAKGTTKINASAIFPHDVVRGMGSNVDTDVIDAQWNALPDYCNGKASDILVMSDVSGSMYIQVSGSVTAMSVSVALGLYISERQIGPFKDLVLTFSESPTFHKVHGNGIVERIKNLSCANWGTSTNLDAAFKLVLDTATQNNVPAEDMPKYLLILTDLEFDQADRKGTNFQAARARYKDAGYEMPKIVFWNLNSRSGTVPVRYNDQGVALVSGFSPAILKTILAADDFTPRQIVLDAIMSPRYNVLGVTV
jgi:hypothetical protein